MEPVPADPAGRSAALARFLEGYVAELEPLSRRHGEAAWLANVTGLAEHQEASARLDGEIRRLHARPEPFAFLCALADAGGVPDPVLQRQLVLVRNACQAHQIPADRIERMVRLEKSLESRFNHFRAELDGRRVGDNELKRVLRESDDPAARRRAWEASKQVGAEVERELLELVRERNAAARAMGAPDYHSMMLTLDELDGAELFALLDALDRATRPLWDAYRDTLDARLAERFGVPRAALRPWHFGDPFFQEAPVAGVDLSPWFANASLADLTARFFTAIGLPVDEALARSDLDEREGKCPHAFCVSVDRADDVRVLCNIQPNEYWMGTMLHEFGHAAYDLNVDRTLPWVLRGPAHTLTTEASAMLFGRLARNAAWLTRWAGMPADEARAAADACARATRAQLLVQTRWELVMCHMERALYADPEQDLRTLWWDLVERFQGVTRPEGRDAPDWASKIHFSIAPVYYQNYLLGEMMASQLQARLLAELGGGEAARERFVGDPAVGAFLRERLYAPGRLRDWRGALVHATGHPLDAAGFVAGLAG